MSRVEALPFFFFAGGLGGEGRKARETCGGRNEERRDLRHPEERAERGGGFAKFSFVSYLNSAPPFFGFSLYTPRPSALSSSCSFSRCPPPSSSPPSRPARRALINAPANNVFSPRGENPPTPPSRWTVQTYAELKTHLAARASYCGQALSPVFRVGSRFFDAKARDLPRWANGRRNRYSSLLFAMATRSLPR